MNNTEFSKNQLKLAKDKIEKNLDELISNNKNFNFSVSNFDNFNDYVMKIKSKIKNEISEYYSAQYITHINEKIENILEIQEKTFDNESDSKKINNYIEKTINEIQLIHHEISSYISLKDKFKELAFNKISDSIDEVNNEINNFRRLRNIADTGLTEIIYNNAVSKQQKLEKKYRKYFYRTVGVVLLLALTLLAFKSGVIKFLAIGDIEFWALKISILVVGITLISYFLKQSTHYQKLADQNYQTQVELQAYPSFMESVPTNEAAAIRKELALKYFGREIDGSTQKDMSNLISDQMKNTTELVKATTDAIKNLKTPN